MGLFAVLLYHKLNRQQYIQGHIHELDWGGGGGGGGGGGCSSQHQMMS